MATMGTLRRRLFLALGLCAVALVAWLAEAAADLATWTTGIVVILALVPLAIWTSAVLSSAVAVLSLVLVARAQSPALSK